MLLKRGIKINRSIEMRKWAMKAVANGKIQPFYRKPVNYKIKKYRITSFNLVCLH